MRSDSRLLSIIAHFFFAQPEYMLMLSSVLVEDSSPIHVRNAAGLALKNALTAKVRAHIIRPSRSTHTLSP